MIKESNTRITITISRKQYKWLYELCQKKKMKMSKLISWMLYQKSNDVEHTKRLLENPKEEFETIKDDEYISDEEMKEILEDLKNMKKSRLKNFLPLGTYKTSA